MERDYAGAAKRALELGVIWFASYENYSAGTACCLCWMDVQEGEQVVPVYEDIWRPAHVSCVKALED